MGDGRHSLRPIRLARLFHLTRSRLVRRLPLVEPVLLEVDTRPGYTRWWLTAHLFPLLWVDQRDSQSGIAT